DSRTSIISSRNVSYSPRSCVSSTSSLKSMSSQPRLRSNHLHCRIHRCQVLTPNPLVADFFFKGVLCDCHGLNDPHGTGIFKLSFDAPVERLFCRLCAGLGRTGWTAPSRLIGQVGFPGPAPIH